MDFGAAEGKTLSETMFSLYLDSWKMLCQTAIFMTCNFPTDFPTTSSKKWKLESSSTMRVGNNERYTEYNQQEKVTKVYYASGNGSKYGGGKISVN